MWSRRKSYFLIIGCSFGGIKRFIIPIPLFVLDITFDAIADLAIIGDLFFPKVSINDVVNLCREIINEFRYYGRWQMARIEAEKVSVYIDFW